MFFRACRKVSCACCSLGFVLGGTITVVLVSHVMDNYTAKKEEVSNYTLLEDLDCEGYDVMSTPDATPRKCARICDHIEGCVAFGYVKTNNRRYMCNFKNNCQHLSHIKNADTYLKGRDRIGRGVFDGKKSCYYIPLTAGSFDDMTKYCRKRNMQLVVLETLQEYKFLANIIKRDDLDCEGNGFISSRTAATPQECAGICRATDAFIYDKRANPYMCKCINQCQQLIQVENVNTYLKGRDHFGCGIFAGKKSCYYIPRSSGNFDDMTKLCQKLNMQMVVLETWEEYKFISNIIKRGNMKIQMHISIKKISGTFYWIYPNDDRVQLDYGPQRAWAPGEPGTHECVYFWAVYPGKWDDYMCSYDQFTTICEIMY